jgi:choice-of-anchor B domain-containing protein
MARRLCSWLACAPILLAACGDNDRGDTLAVKVRTTPELSTLHRVLDRAGLMDSLDDGDSLTLLAPTNDAFALFLSTQGITEADLLADPELRAMMQHHVLPDEHAREDLAARAAVASVEGHSIGLATDSLGLEIENDTRLVGDSIQASNGVLHQTDAVLGRATATTHDSPGPVTLEQVTFDSIVLDEAGFVRDLEVDVDLELDFVFGVTIYLQHEPSGEFVPLVSRPWTFNEDIKTTFSDHSLLDVVDDLPFGEGGGPAFPAPRYRPLQPLRFMYGLPAAGQWNLIVYAFVPMGGGTPTLNGWHLRLVTTEERPDPSVAMAPLRDVSGVTAHGLRETLPVLIKRTAGLTEPVTVTVTADGITSEPAVVDADRAIANVPFAAAAGAVDGPVTFQVDVASSRRRRVAALDGEIVTIDASGVELLAQISLADLGAPGGEGNDVWGWTDPVGGREYALMGTSHGTAFVDVSAPAQPVLVGFLPTQTDDSLWRDIKVHRDHAYIVSEAADHGLQIFDLTRLRGVTSPQTFTPTAHHDGFGNAHNIVIDETSGYAYVVGATEGEYPDLCSGGLYMLDLAMPAAPVFAGCFAGAVPAGQTAGPAFPTTAYTHDGQCVVYQGPDVAYQGRQICFTSDGQIDGDSFDFLGIADVTDKGGPAQLARVTYNDSPFDTYAHQGWLTEDHQYFLLNDEFDETEGVATRTYVFDVRSLAAPTLLGTFDNPRATIGHNAYVKDGFLYQANYTSGLRIVDLAGVASMTMAEVAYFDTSPEDDRFDTPTARCRTPGQARGRIGVAPHPGQTGACGAGGYAGAWSNYPYFASGTILVSDMQRGLFVVRRTP